MAAPASHTARDAALRALGWSAGPLRIGGLDAAELVARFGSPLYVHDATALRARIGAVRAACGDRIGLLLALKANPLAALTRVAHAAGCGGDVVSGGEILVARHAGVPGDAIRFAGPGKSAVDLDTALDHGVHLNLESAREHERLAERAAARGLRPEVSIRVNPGVAQSGARLRMAEQSSRFGVDAGEVLPLAHAIAARGVCTLRGLHVYGGSQSFDAAAWLDTAAGLLQLADAVAADRGRPLDRLNFGGGFGWPMYDGDPEFDLTAAGTGLRALLADRADLHAELELGRYLLAGGGVYLSRIADVKTSGGHRQVVLDGGMHQFGAAAGLGAVMRRAYAIVPAHAPDAAADDALPTATVGGVLCTPADRFAQRLPLPALAPGDLLAVLNAGAYGLTFSPSRFLGHPTAAEVVVDEGVAKCARRRGTPGDALRDQEP